MHVRLRPDDRALPRRLGKERLGGAQHTVDAAEKPDSLSRLVPQQSPIISTLPIALPKFQRIVDDFIVKLGERIAEMHSAHMQGDWDRLARLAHWLKGSGGTVGFDCLTSPASELEQFARQRDASSAGRVLDDLSALADRITPVTA